MREFPGGPVVKTWCFPTAVAQGSTPRVGELRPRKLRMAKKKRKVRLGSM